MAAGADELLLLERVFLRVGSAESDEQLQNAVCKFLPPVLLKLSSQQEGVRKKVMELLIHINKRVKSRPLVQLPVEALLLQYQDPSASSFVTNFTIIYIKMGFPRLPTDKQAELVPSVLNSLESKPQSHQDSLLLLIIPLLGSVKVPSDPQKRSALFGLNEKPHITKLLLSLMLDMLLLPYGSCSQPQTSGQPSESDVTFRIPSGMSQYTFKRVTADNPLKPEELEQIKLGIVTFLAHGVLPDSDILLHLIVAAADTRFGVANLANLELKKIIGGLDWSSSALAMQLYHLYLGTQGNVLPVNKKCPANTRIRLKLLHYLCKVTDAGFVIPACIQVIFDSLYGANTNTRLKSLALTFTTNLIQQADIKDLTPVGSLLLCGMTKLTDEGEPIHQGQAYIIIGLIGRKMPSLICNDLSLLEKLFKKLVSETPDIRLQIREGMLNLVSAYKYDSKEKVNIKDSNIVLLYSLLSQFTDNEEPMVRFVAIRFMATIFPPNHIPSKYLLLLATGDTKDDVVTEATKALYDSATKKEMFGSTPGSLETNKKFSLPSFSKIVNYIYTEANSRMKKPGKCYVNGNQTLPFPPNVYKEIIIYLRLCMLQNTDLAVSRDIIRHPTEQTPIIGKFLKSLYRESDPVEVNPLLQYLFLTKKLLRANTAIEPLCCIVEAIGCIPKLHVMFSEDLPWIKELLNSTKEEIREHASLLYGIIVANSYGDAKFNEAVNGLLLSTENNKLLETQHGSLLGVANCLEKRITAKNIDCNTLLSWDLYKNSLVKMNSFLDHSSALMINAACMALGLIGRCAPLPFSSNEKATETVITKLSVTEKLLEVMNNVKLPAKVRERSARTLGLICVGETFPHTKEVIEGLLKTSKDTKDIEMHFTVGDSLLMCVQNIWSPEARDSWTTLPEEYTPINTMLEAPPDDHLSWLLAELLKYVSIPHPNSRQASCVWLLTLLKRCATREPIKTHLNEIQSAFMDLLSENNDIVVDVASKGLGLVFETSETDLGSTLLTQLVDQLQTGRKSIPQVTGETKLFEEGELGKSPTGGNLSTYKELCSLASDLNKPDLIYKFMQLANHNTIWNSKKGAAFGFLTIASKAGEQLKPHLPKIIPKLYRYKFDPTPNLQNSMDRIWHALVPETQKTVDEYYKEILADLITNLTAPQWRVRQSCCLALQDFLRSGANRSIHDIVDSINELWTQLFRVMDDVHEGTRIAATNTTKTLSKLCIRACDATYGKNGTKMIEVLLPVLLENGITNSVATVRAISLQTVSQLVEAASSKLKPFLPLLIPALLQATGDLEYSKLSQLSTQQGADAQTQEIIDSFRASAAKSHYTTETMGKCLQYADATILDELVPKVLDLMKSSVGLGTKIACAHFITLLTVHIGKDLQPYTGKFLAALVNGLTDRNTTIRKHYASAIGSLVSSAKDSSLEKLFGKISTWYYEREDENTRLACAHTLQSIATSNQDILKNYSDVVLPLVFFAMHAEKNPEHPQNVEIWADVWAEISPGTETGIRQNLEEICKILKKCIGSPSWTMKAQAANTISTVASKLGSNFEVKYMKEILEMLISGLSGRTWNGKEKLLKAIASICKNCKDALKSNPEFQLSELIDAVIKESKKENIVYRRQALETLGDVLSALEIDKFEDLYKNVQAILSKDNIEVESEDDDLSSEETNRRQEEIIRLKETVYETLGKAWPADPNTQEKYSELFAEHCVTCLPSTTRAIQVSVMVALCQFVDKLAILKDKEVSPKFQDIFPKILDNIIEALTYALGITKHTRLRKEALNVIISLGKGLKEKNRTADFKKLCAKMDELLPNLEKDHQPEIRSRVSDIKNLLKTVETS